MPTEQDNFFSSKLTWDLKYNVSTISITKYLAALMMFTMLLQRLGDKERIDF